MAAVPEPVNFVDPIFTCLNEDTSFFNVDLDGGIGPVAIGAIGSFLGGIGLVLDFLPVPDPLKIPDLVADMAKPEFLPNLFVKPFAAPGLPAIPIEIEGFSFNVGTVDIPGFKPEGLINLVTGLITLPLKIFDGLIKSIIKLDPKIPDFDGMLKIGLRSFKELGFNVKSGGPISQLLKCLITIFVTIIKELLPI